MEGEFLDSRDLQERLEELEEKKNNREGDLIEEEEEFEALEKLKEECEDYGWEHGITFIADWHFRDYCQELAEDCYNMDSENPLMNHIDWQSWADAVEMDYTQTEYNDTTWLFREV